MLVLSRRPGESIVIGDAVVRVVGVQGRRVKLGIDAPVGTQIARQEVAHLQQNRQVEAKTQEAAAS